MQDYCHLRCWRADSESVGNRIMSDVWRATNEAFLMIADLSGNNANVFYEVGLAHAIGKPVILLTSNTDDIPFDVRDIRTHTYDLTTGFRELRAKLLTGIRSSAVTLPARWEARSRLKSQSAGVCVTDVKFPLTVATGQPFEISVRARNDGPAQHEGYFSVSFPEAVDDLSVEIVQTDIAQQIGRSKSPWCDDTVILSYPIAEAYSSPWKSGREHFVKVRARSDRTGWLPFFVSASSKEITTQEHFDYDPGPGLPHIDQRGETVYCGIIDVSA